MSVSDERSKLEKLLAFALSSEQTNEVLAATRAIRDVLASEDSDVHELAARLRNNKLSEAEMRKIYEAGRQAERDAAAVNAGFSSVDGPSYLEMARYASNMITAV